MNEKHRRIEQSLYDRMQSFAVPPQAQVDASRERVRQRLFLQDRAAVDRAMTDVARDEGRTKWPWLLMASAALLVAVGVLPRLVENGTALATVEGVGGSLHRISGDTQPLLRGDSIQQSQTLRAVDGTAILHLVDNSQVEMGSQSELSLEPAPDGLRIRLNKGGVIVTAARQPAGHLYVQTNDVIVSVIGTIFLVKAQEQGSRVVVIQGEVEVQQGTTLKKLLPGQQVVSTPRVVSSLLEEISWSKSAAAHLVSLQQSVFTPAATKDAFELASVRPSKGPDNGGGRCGNIQIDRARFVASKTSLYTLIALAYGKNCLLLNSVDFIVGGPGWIRSERFDVQALIPEGSPTYTLRQLQNGEAPRLQAMIQGLLADRFKLLLHRDLREMSIFELASAKSALRLTPSKDSDTKAVRWQPQPDQNGQLPDRIEGRKASMTDLANILTLATRRPVVDRTGIVGEFNFDIDFAVAATKAGPSVFAALEELGLKLESAKGPVEVLVVDQAERPSEN